jgi:hypothetical protein
MVTSAWTCWVVFLYALVVFGVTLSLLQAAYNKAKDHVLATGDADVRDAQGLTSDGFWRSVAPSLGHWLTVTLLMAASIALPMVGSLFVLGLLCAVVPIAWRWWRSTAA